MGARLAALALLVDDLEDALDTAEKAAEPDAETQLAHRRIMAQRKAAS